MDRRVLKLKAIELRKEGKSYSEICSILDVTIPKSTLATWFKGIPMTLFQKEEIREKNLVHLSNIRVSAHGVIAQKRKVYLTDLLVDNLHLSKLLQDKNVAKIALAMLYLGEGGKAGSYISFGNSNPRVIDLYLKLLRKCYIIDDSKFRVTVQCRADQKIEYLIKFWYAVTNISKKQFYPTQIDPRTIGKPTQKVNYKGVCKIDYFSAYIFDDLIQAIKAIYLGP